MSIEASEQRLDLGEVGPAQAEPDGKSVSGAVKAQAGEAGVVAGGEHDLGDAGRLIPVMVLTPR